MLRLLIGAPLLLAGCFAAGQTSRFPSDRDMKFVVELEYRPEVRMPLPVSAIHLLDARFDQTIIGSTTGEYMLRDNTFTNKDAVFPESFAPYLERKLTNWFALDPASPDRLLVLVKKFRTIDNVTRMLTTSTRKEVFLQMEISYFLQHGNMCYRIGGTDEWFSSDHVSETVYRGKKDLQAWLITNVLVSEISGLSFRTDSTSITYTRQQLDRGLEQRFALPVLREAPRKGIYRSFADFLANTPSDTSFIIGMNKEDEIVITDSLRHRLNSGNTWAVCDSAQCVFFVGQHFYEMTPQDKSFRIRTHRVINLVETISAVNDLYGLGVISKKVNKLYNNAGMPDYLDIDMETGELLLEELVGPYNAAMVAAALRRR